MSNPFRPVWPPVVVKSCGPVGADPCDPLEFSRGAYHASKMVETFTPAWLYKQLVVEPAGAAGLPYECCKDENRPGDHDRAAAMHQEIATMARNGHIALSPDVLAMHDTAVKLHRMAASAGRGVVSSGL
jgi:hypothetical protein